MRHMPIPVAPCVVTKYVDGKPVVTETITRAPLPDVRNKKEPEVFKRRLRVMARQETGEECFVAYAQGEYEAALLMAAHEVIHPEHDCFFEFL